MQYLYISAEWESSMKIGIVGGIGPESTIDYYKKIIQLYRNKVKDGSYPEIVINSVDMNKMMDIMIRSGWDELCSMLSHAVEELKNAGAEIAIIASNTPHIVFEKVKNLVKLPLLSIVEATGEYVAEMGCRKVGLLGTGFTMKEHFYQDVLSKFNIETVVPSGKQQEYIHEKLFSEIELGIIKQETKNEFIRIVNAMIEKFNIEGIILGCTELPMIMNQNDFSIPVIDTVEIHVRKLIEIITK
jgi:aspartate racemase